ncbi:unnamed protein product [Durusdinium trenchii]|uniref:Uncharacterized protein n=1 Tax=Durusdinium trenchii TaxID=1381693 RepID=A0ABP0N653_9DINO
MTPSYESPMPPSEVFEDSIRPCNIMQLGIPSMSKTWRCHLSLGEHFEDAFALRLRKTLPAGEVLRIQNPEDPVVDLTTLDQKGLKCCDVWWVRDGGHVMCFGASRGLAWRLRKWVECKATLVQI